MALVTVLTKPAVVLVVLAVAGIAVLRGVGIEVVSMAVSASRVFMTPGQVVVGLIMVYVQAAPVINAVTGSAVLTGGTLVLVVLAVAGVAVLGSILKCGDRPRLLMTLSTVERPVFTLKREGRKVVVKIGAISIDAIMAFQTVLTKIIEVALREDRVDLPMTRFAGTQFKVVQA